MSDRFDHTLERKLDTKRDDADDGGAPVRRIELITGSGRRRRWSGDEKARIIVESLAPGASVSEVARRHGLTPQQLFGWRREARELFSEDTGAAGAVLPAVHVVPPSPSPATGPKARMPGSAPAFAPVVIAVPATPPPSAPSVSSTPPAKARAVAAGLIEIAIGEAIVRVSGRVEAGQLAAVLAAVRRAS